jgi:hypothetical protein
MFFLVSQTYNSVGSHRRTRLATLGKSVIRMVSNILTDFGEEIEAMLVFLIVPVKVISLFQRKFLTAPRTYQLSHHDSFLGDDWKCNFYASYASSPNQHVRLYRAVGPHSPMPTSPSHNLH